MCGGRRFCELTYGYGPEGSGPCCISPESYGAVTHRVVQTVRPSSRHDETVDSSVAMSGIGRVVTGSSASAASSA